MFTNTYKTIFQQVILIQLSDKNILKIKIMY